MVFYITTNLNQRDGWIGISYEGCPCRHMNTYDLYWFIICSYIFSTQHLLLQYLLQHFSKTSRNLAGHSRAGTLEGASCRAFKLLRLHPRKLTWRPKIAIFERRYIFQIIILCIYLDFRRCMQTKASLGSHIWDCITVKFQPAKMFMKCMKVKDVQSFLSQKPL